MSIFCFKKLDSTKRLGTRLKEAREARGLTLTQVLQNTRIPLAYLEAIEAGKFSKLPKAIAFRRAYIKEYALAVGLTAESCAEQLISEAGLADVPTKHPHKHISFSPFASLSIALRNSLMIGAAALFAGYLLWQVKGVLQPPKLELFAPLEGEVINQLSMPLQGQTDPEVALSVNGDGIMVNEKGQFATTIDLAPGLNTLTIQALKKHGKTTTITRHVVARGQKSVNPVSLGAQNLSTN